MGGFCKWWCVPKEKIATWPAVDPLTQYLVTEPTLITGAAWFGPVMVPDDALGFEEPIQRNAAGFYYKQKVTGFYPGDDAFSRINLGNMPWHQYVIVAQMRAGGFFMLLGTQERGLQFDADYASGNGGISTAGAKFAFTLNALEKGHVLLEFSEAPAIAPPGYQTPGEPTGTDTENQTEIITYTAAETTKVIEWTAERQAAFGLYPQIQVWVDGPPAEMISAGIAVDAVPPAQTEFTITLPGVDGFIVLK